MCLTLLKNVFHDNVESHSAHKKNFMQFLKDKVNAKANLALPNCLYCVVHDMCREIIL